jgi:hypothetical protein
MARRTRPGVGDAEIGKELSTMTPSVGVLTWADGDSGCIRQRRAKVRRDRRDSESADMDVFDRVKTPEPVGVLEPAA